MDTLSKEEMDALKDAVKTGEAFDGAEQGDAAEDSGQVKVATYDFRKPHLISEGQQATIRLLHETASKTLHAMLFARLKTTVEVKLVSVEQVTFREFMDSLANPTYMATFKTEPNIGAGVMELSLSLAMTTLDIILGSDGKGEAETRELTTLENNIIKGVTDLCLQELSGAWSNLAPVSFELASQIANPEYCQIHTAETSCMGVTYDIHIGDVSGIMNVCYPFKMIQTALGEAESRLLKESSEGGESESGSGGRNEMLGALSGAPLDLRTVVGTGKISAQQLASLKPGDVLCLDNRLGSLAEVFIGDRLSFKGEVGQRRGMAAVGIIAPCYSTQGGKVSE
ncbi:hypothetical protein BVX97_01580 [bacterium E08(2017)]|nr:hypothetical protein BVX97_01580 [bacterium E08(2017)]